MPSKNTGRFVWHDLMTKDAARAETFYCALLGWRIENVPLGGWTYKMILAQGGGLGGIVQEPGIPHAHWMPYVQVDDVDAAAKQSASLGGTTCVPPSDIPNIGRFAVLGDPQGGTFSIYRGLKENDADLDTPVDGRACWNELWTTDVAGALRYYSAMFGWKDEPSDMGPMGTYHVQVSNGKQAGGIMKDPRPGAQRPSWNTYFQTSDVEASTRRAVELGGTSCMGVTPIPGVGRFSMLTDPTGALFALFQGG